MEVQKVCIAVSISNPAPMEPNRLLIDGLDGIVVVVVERGRVGIHEGIVVSVVVHCRHEWLILPIRPINLLLVLIIGSDWTIDEWEKVVFEKKWIRGGRLMERPPMSELTIQTGGEGDI